MQLYYPTVQDFLLGLTTPHFYPWELGDISVPRMRLVNSGLSNCALAAELLHRAAYRDRGLGMSQYAPNHMVSIVAYVQGDTSGCSQTLYSGPM